MRTGAIYCVRRGYGFIRPAGGGVDIFLHRTAWMGAEPFDKRLLFAPVSYDVEMDREGRPRAVDVRFLEPAEQAIPQ